MSAKEALDAYRAGVEELRSAVSDLTPEQLRAWPIPGKMSTLEVLCHLADFEPILADRMKRVIAMDEPPLLSADEERFRERLAYHDRDPREELQLIELIRKQMARILATLPPEAWQRAGRHSERGLLSLADLLATATRHIRHHLPFIHEKRRALGLPVSGQK